MNLPQKSSVSYASSCRTLLATRPAVSLFSEHIGLSQNLQTLDPH